MFLYFLFSLLTPCLANVNNTSSNYQELPIYIYFIVPSSIIIILVITFLYLKCKKKNNQIYPDDIINGFIENTTNENILYVNSESDSNSDTEVENNWAYNMITTDL